MTYISLLSVYQYTTHYDKIIMLFTMKKKSTIKFNIKVTTKMPEIKCIH
jgi:hypothetical protein